MSIDKGAEKNKSPIVFLYLYVYYNLQQTFKYVPLRHDACS